MLIEKKGRGSEKTFFERQNAFATCKLTFKLIFSYFIYRVARTNFTFSVENFYESILSFTLLRLYIFPIKFILNYYKLRIIGCFSKVQINVRVVE